jgi:hypothetical protein
MARTVLWAPTVLILTFAVLASAAAKSKSHNPFTKQCEDAASECLVGCASLDTRTKAYRDCVPRCNRERDDCLLFSTRK